MNGKGGRQWVWIGVGGILLLGCLVVGWTSFFLQQTVRYPAGVYIGEQLYTLEYALTQDARSRGLGDRESLCATCAMAFPFKIPGKYGFWMKGMRFPLDIVWVAENGRVVHIQRAISPESQEVYRPEEPASLVLEFNAGILDAVGVGDTLRYSSFLSEEPML